MVQDLRQAVRFLVKSKGFTLVAVAALAVGIGANVTLFGFVSSLVLRPMDAVELGMAGSLVAARLLQACLNGIHWSDPIPLTAAAFLLAATGYAACLGPARRASRTDPMAALRE